jgi:hypothetical protein
MAKDVSDAVPGGIPMRVVSPWKVGVAVWKKVGSKEEK